MKVPQAWRQRLKGAISALVLSLMLLIAAWLVSNWNDVPPQPRPAALNLPSPSVPDARNAYFTLAGIHAAPDRDPSTAGQALWKQGLDHVGKTFGDRYVPNHDTPVHDTEPIIGQQLPGMAGPPLVCESQADVCVDAWIDAAEALRVQREAHALFGARCERLLESDFVFDEALPPMRSSAEPFALHASAASACSRWLLSGAVLAWVQKDQHRLGRMLAQADRLNRKLLNASHSLIGQVIAMRLTHNTLDVATSLGVRDPGLTPALASLLEPLPDQVRNIKRWMAVEAAFLRGVISEVEQQPRLSAGEWDIGHWLTRLHIGWHPERTMQVIDARWLRSIAQLDEGLEATMRAEASAGLGSASGSTWHGLTWVNPVGSMLIDISRPAYADYLARHADLVLHHEVAALAINAAAAGIPGTERRAWTVTQSLSPATRSRITWSDDGLVLTARSWQETNSPGRPVSARDEIRVVWPAAR